MYRELANFVDMKGNTSSYGGKQRHELSGSDKKQRQYYEPPETVANNLQFTMDLQMFSERGAKVSDLRGEAASELL